MFRMAPGSSHSLPFWLCDLASAVHGLARIATVLRVNAIRRHGNVVAVQQQQHPEHAHTNSSIIVVARWPADKREQIQMTQQVAASNCFVGRRHSTVLPSSVPSGTKNFNFLNSVPYSGKRLISISRNTLQHLRFSLMCFTDSTF